MKGIARRKALALCCMAGALLMTVPYAEASSKSKKPKVEVKYDFEAGLMQCHDVVNPQPWLLNCGTDPLIGGKVKIERDGSVEVHVAGAVASALYNVIYHSLDGSTVIGNIQTDPYGNAMRKWMNVFAFGKTSSGILVVQRGDLDQFVSGFAVVTSGYYDDHSDDD